jgi:hypothetical protein
LSLDIFPNLKSLDVSGCKNLKAITISGKMRLRPPILDSLCSLSISNCPKLVCFPTEGFFAPKLTLLSIDNCEELKSLPPKMDLHMPSLIELQLWRCPQLQPIEKWPTDLRSVSIYNCDQLVARQLEWKQSNPIDFTDLTASPAFTVKSEDCFSTITSSTLVSDRKALSSSSQKKSFVKRVFR